MPRSSSCSRACASLINPFLAPSITPRTSGFTFVSMSAVTSTALSPITPPTCEILPAAVVASPVTTAPAVIVLPTTSPVRKLLTVSPIAETSSISPSLMFMALRTIPTTASSTPSEKPSLIIKLVRSAIPSTIVFMLLPIKPSSPNNFRIRSAPPRAWLAVVAIPAAIPVITPANVACSSA